MANKKGVKNNNSTPKKQCEGECKRELVLANFYNTNSAFSSDGKVNICKHCLEKMIDYNNMESIYKILQLMDIPFLSDYWETAKIKKPNNPWGSYIRMANSKINEFENKTWKDSKFEMKNEINSTYVPNYKNMEFEVTQEMILNWGTKYEPEDYYELEKFVNNMQKSNTIETAQDIIYLKKLAVISLKLDKALQDGNFSEAKQLGDLFSKYMADSKFRAMDKTDADKTGGIRNFCTIYAEVEKDGFIPPWEHYRKIKGITQDIVDKTIMHIENFTLKLNRIEKMVTPPIDTPKLELYEIDTENQIDINDIEVDESDDYVIKEGEKSDILE